MRKKRIFALCIAALALSCAIGISVTGVSVYAEVARADDGTIVSTYQNKEINMVNAPTVVRDVTDKAAFDACIAATRKPSNVILRMDKAQNVVAEDGTVIDTFAQCYAALAHTMLPVVYIRTAEEADALLAYFDTYGDILDMSVMSDDPALVQKVKASKRALRGIIEYDEAACRPGGTLDLYPLVEATNTAHGLVTVLPQRLATAQNVTYLHARMMTVWVRMDGTAPLDLYDCVFSGAYGVITRDSEATYDFLQRFDDKTYTRSPFLIAHRGLPYTHNENSVSGVKAAITAGATHLELDGYATKAAEDGSRDIVLMHDDDLSRTTTGTGNVFEYTLEQLRAFRLKQFSDEAIPTLGDVLEVIKGKDVVLVFELKQHGDNAIVTLLKQYLDTYDCYDQVVVITFDTTKLAEMQRVLPQVPTADLNMLGGRNSTEISKSYMARMLDNMGIYNTHIDPPKDCTDEEFDRYWLRDRGIVGWYWTFETELQVLNGWRAGYVGITNDRMSDFRKDRRMVCAAEDATAETMTAGDRISLVSMSYNGARTDIQGEVAYCEPTEGGWRVVSAAAGNRTVYTQSYFVRDTNAIVPDKPAPPDPETPAPNEKGGCGGAVGGEATAAALSALFVALLSIVRRRMRAAK